MKKLKWTTLLLLIFIITLEQIARFLGFGHPLIYKASGAGYELVAGQTVNRLGKSTHINALGTRGPELTKLPGEGVYRILVLGDSVANGGTRINDDETWPLQLQGILSQSGKTVEVANASAGGWAVQNEAEWLAEHGTLGAKLIVLAVNEKDLDQAFVGPEILDSNISFPSKYPATALGEIITRYILPVIGYKNIFSDPGSTTEAFQSQNAEAFFDAVEKIYTFADAKRVKLAILYWDLRAPAPAEVVPARDRLLAYASQHGITLIRPNLNKDRKGDHLFFDNIHPNAEGNTTIAKLLSLSLPL